MLPMLSPAPSATGLFDRAYSNKVLSYNPIAYWPLWEPSGAVAHCLTDPLQNGTYINTVPDQAGIGDGRRCPSFGANACVNIYSATLNTNFDGTLGTVMAWAKVSGAGVWTDGTWRRVVVVRVDLNNRVSIHRTATNGQAQLFYISGGANKTVNIDALSTLGWMCFAMTWDKTADQAKMYYGGLQTGATATGLGLWVGNLDSARTVIGSSANSIADAWSGYIAHVALWDAALTPDAIANLAVV